MQFEFSREKFNVLDGQLQKKKVDQDSRFGGHRAAEVHSQTQEGEGE